MLRLEEDESTPDDGETRFDRAFTTYWESRSGSLQVSLKDICTRYSSLVSENS
jgi:hypothetical protein